MSAIIWRNLLEIQSIIVARLIVLSKSGAHEHPVIIPVIDAIAQAAIARGADRRPGQASGSTGAEGGPAPLRLAGTVPSDGPAEHGDESAGRPATEPMADPRSAAERGEGNAVSWTVDIVLAYLARNSVDSQALPKLIADLHGVLEQISTSDRGPERPPETGRRPAVPVGLSVMPDYIICLEDGRRFRSMKRYIKAAYNLTPDEYRDRWGLPASYPMTAPGYTEMCSARAKARKLGRRPAR
ncbi:MucR family transcriptional regulator [Inquilinus sp. CA228]|uniref:MucR family transcriptional regulator n=1 Tax=Inquilinus sp. CA228 TaxID=3455609 RepID=UPI003F8D20AC